VHNGKPQLKFDDLIFNPSYYVNYEYLLWKNKPQEEAATPILGYHRNAIKPIKSFKEMLLEKCTYENVPNSKNSELLPNSWHATTLQPFLQDPSPLFQHKKFDINALISPLMTSYPLYSRANGFHSNPQSPLIPPPLRPEAKMIFHEPSNLQNSSMKLHPGYSQFKKEIFETNGPEFIPHQYQDYIPKNNIQQQSVEFRPTTFNQAPPEMPQNPQEKFSGRLKFFDEMQNYGFFIMDVDGSDLFVHYEDLKKAGLTKEFLKVVKGNAYVRFTFNCVSYYGKYSLSRKAINIEYLFETEPKHEYGFMQ
jgi:'Cold-shock' DNA-binding domain